MIGDAGFTLGETLTAVGLASVVSLVAMPSITTIHGQYQLMSTANQLAFEISRARMQAVGQNVFVRIVVLGENQYAREVSTDGVAYVRDGAITTLPSGLTISAGETDPPGFNRNGVAATRTVITLSGPRGQKAIETNVVGRVTVS